MEDPARDVKLSKSVLEMKFMKKTKERVQREAEDAEGNAMYSGEITDDMRKTGNIVFTEAGIFHCKNLVEGRLSFGGMNPDVEKLMLSDYAKQMQEEEKRKETDITDAEMAQTQAHSSSLVNTLNSKFTKKNKRKFLKPADD